MVGLGGLRGLCVNDGLWPLVNCILYSTLALWGAVDFIVTLPSKRLGYLLVDINQMCIGVSPI